MGRRVLVVGATSPIGVAIAQAFADNGDIVFGAALDESPAPPYAGSIVADCATVSGCGAVVEAAVAAMGGIDVLVPAAAWQSVAPAGETTDADWHRTIDTVLSGAFYLFRAALPHLASGSSMVAVSSVNAFLAAPGFPAYAAAKAGLNGLVRQLALEYGPRGIRVNAVAPGTIVAGTPLAPLTAGYPIGRVGRPEEVASAVLFLAGNGFVTGVTLPVDGGLSIASPAAFLRDDLQERWKRALG